MRPDQTGVLVTRVTPLGPSAGKLLPGDVIMSLDNYSLHNDGSVIFRNKERIGVFACSFCFCTLHHLVNLSFFFVLPLLGVDFLLHKKFAGESATLKILRDGNEMELSLPVRPAKHLVPVFKYDTTPSYFIYAGILLLLCLAHSLFSFIVIWLAGLVFTPLTQPLLHEVRLPPTSCPFLPHLLLRCLLSIPTGSTERRVVLSMSLFMESKRAKIKKSLFWHKVLQIFSCL
jgi:hypothetical protein